MADILGSSLPSIHRVASQNRQLCIDLILIALNDFLEFAGKDLTENQKINVCSLVLETYPYYTIDHIRLCFKRIKKGQYGSIYGDINGMVLMEFFKKFDIEIDTEIAEFRKIESLKNKKADNYVLPENNVGDEKSRAWQLLKADLKKIGEEKEGKKENLTIQIKQPSSIIQKWLKEFDELYKKTGRLNEHFKTVEYCGERIGLMKFLETKEEELKLI